MNGKKKSRMKLVAKLLAFILVIAMILGSVSWLFVAFGADAESEIDARQRMADLYDVMEIISDTYKDDISYSELVDAAYEGVFSKLDPWTVYYRTEEEEKDFEDSVNGVYGGVGIELIQNASGVKINRVFSGSPAAQAGIEAGGYVVFVDDTPIETSTQAAELLRGKEGTKVKITIDYSGQLKSYRLTRAVVVQDTVYYEMKDGDIGYIRIDQMSQNTAKEFMAARLALLNRGMKGMVLDLRNNGGGYIDVAVNIANQLLNKDCVIVSYENKGENAGTMIAGGNKTRQVPIAILTNEGTASASELLTAALKQNGAAITVGTTTFGKGVAQSVYDLGEGSYLKISVVYMVGPSGKTFHETGLAPDYIVFNPGGYSKEVIEEVTKDVIPMDEGVKYKKGEKGRNVLAAQQRLYLLGYDVEETSVLDDKTYEAIKEFQRRTGLFSYGALDFTTISMLGKAFGYLISSSEEDMQLAKAVELLK